MKTYIIIGFVIIIGLSFFFISCGNKSSKSESKDSVDRDTPKIKITHTKGNAYEGLRSMAFNITPAQLGLSLPTDKTIVYGVIMDWEIDGGVATTVAYQTGDASMYLSTGGGVIGGGQHLNVNSAAKHFVEMAQDYLEKTTKTETTPLPDKGTVIFYLLTNKGIYKGQEEMKQFENNSSPWLGLFNEGNNLISELRLTSTGKN